MAQVIAPHVFTVLHEFDTLAEVRTAVHAREEAFDDVTRPQLHAADALDRLRMQKSFGIGHRWLVRLLW